MHATVRPTNKPVILKGVIIVLVLLFSVTLTGVPCVRQLLGLQNWVLRFFVSRLLFWACLAFTWFYCTKKEGQPLLLWPEVKYPFWMYLLSVVVVYSIILIGSGLIAGLLLYSGAHLNQVREKEMMDMLRGRYGLILLASFTAGIVEEMLFRGYILPRLAFVFGSNVLAVIISSALFGLLHFTYNNWYHIAVTFFIGLVFALHYVKYRNIKILIISHFLWDIIILLLKAR